MAYVVPTTRADGYVVDAAEWNKNTVDNPIALKALIDAIGTAAVRRCDGRLTLTTAVPVTTADVTAATTLYWAPYAGSQVALYDGAAWAMYTFTEKSIAVPATTSQMYDVFVYNNAGTLTLELTAWANDTTRATALTKQDGVLVKTGATTRRYLGSFRTTGVSGQTEDSVLKRHVWNYYNRVPRSLLRRESTSSWAYNSATIRQANNSASNQVDVVVGVEESPIALTTTGLWSNSTSGVSATVGIGVDSTTVFSTSVGGGAMSSGPGGTYCPAIATGSIYPGIGRHYFAMLEAASAVGVNTFFGGGNFFAGVAEATISGRVDG